MKEKRRSEVYSVSPSFSGTVILIPGCGGWIVLLEVWISPCPWSCRGSLQLLRSAGSILGICCGVLQEEYLRSFLQYGHAEMEGLKTLEKWDLKENFSFAGCLRA